MEDVKEPSFPEYIFLPADLVSILVLMEDVKELFGQISRGKTMQKFQSLF